MSTLTTAINSSGTTTSSTATTTASSSSDTLGYSDFITLLTTELKYQDPTESQDSSQYISQLAQLSTLSQLNTISNSISNVQALNMIGKTATYEYTDSSGNTSTASGTVDSVISSSGSTYLSIDGNTVSLDDVVKVQDTSSSSS